MTSSNNNNQRHDHQQQHQGETTINDKPEEAPEGRATTITPTTAKLY
jgi:hypothetical protein